MNSNLGGPDLLMEIEGIFDFFDFSYLPRPAHCHPGSHLVTRSPEPSNTSNDHVMDI